MHSRIRRGTISWSNVKTRSPSQRAISLPRSLLILHARFSPEQLLERTVSACCPGTGEEEEEEEEVEAAFYELRLHEGLCAPAPDTTKPNSCTMRRRLCACKIIPFLFFLLFWSKKKYSLFSVVLTVFRQLVGVVWMRQFTDSSASIYNIYVFWNIPFSRLSVINYWFSSIQFFRNWII